MNAPFRALLFRARGLRALAFRALMLGVWCGLSIAGASAAELTMVAHEPTRKTVHPPLIVLLHGAGADERDMIGLWRDVPDDFVVVSPRAPFGGGGGFRWYRNISRAADIAISRRIVDLVVDEAVKRFDADPARVFVGGFSQGGVMTYEGALHAPGRFRGAAVLSGSLFPSAQAGLPARDALASESLFIGHGTADTRIPFASATAARATLERRGVPIEFHAYAGMGHATDAAETHDLSAWLAERAK